MKFKRYYGLWRELRISSQIPLGGARKFRFAPSRRRAKYFISVAIFASRRALIRRRRKFYFSAATFVNFASSAGNTAIERKFKSLNRKATRIKFARRAYGIKFNGLDSKAQISYFDMKFNRASADQAARSKRRFANPRALSEAK